MGSYENESITRKVCAIWLDYLSCLRPQEIPQPPINGTVIAEIDMVFDKRRLAVKAADI